MKFLHTTTLQFALLILAACSLVGCTKSQKEFYPEHKIIDVRIQGYIAQDSLQIKLGNRIIKPSEEGDAAYFSGSVYSDQVSNGATTLTITDGKGKLMLERKIETTTLTNIIKFYYDGVSILDKIPGMPKPAAGNVGILVNFPERIISNMALKDIALSVSIMKRGKPTISSLHTFREDGTVFIDTYFPPDYQYFSFKLVNPANPSQKYTPDAMTNSFTLMNPKADKGYLFYVKEVTDANGTFDGISAVELTQYLN
ncbi:hypothetical protein HHL16_10930 [Pseudoflavitalea sp. G-6-1-2]|uniref:hypothetical protein n=1 Tax=Pseudoflavitalea sp. G-6-1-2 TaxID=2728841 RepID=UPI00146C3887|nr:hypothetical protein [Pseudoflavitalea sp. G-6-1-2]NML21391.1 hypothetical protein [Pseudoflavitalea sp. G-6-1-2]